MKTGVVILARLSSKRLPGKALMEVKEKKILTYIIERLDKVVPRTDIILATSIEKEDDLLVEFAKQEAINCYRGDMDNVAERFYDAATLFKWDYAVRINGDNVFVDTEVLRKMLEITDENKYDFISNVKGRTFPKGMSIEIVKLSHYKELLPEINRNASYREHVMLYMYENEKQNYHFVINTDIPQAAGIQLALDTTEDFERTKKIIEMFKDEHWEYNLKEILNICRKQINENI
ncbi:MAG TPA: hypothetical protein PLU58_08230 [Saprospiraceae bacterium]|nr:hypothetical protein [Saprospiraceae bacterium]